MVRVSRWFSALPLLSMSILLTVPKTGLADIVTDWNTVLINAVKTDTGGATSTPGPGWSSRNMAMVQLAVCDAINNAATTHTYGTYAYNTLWSNANQVAAASQAARDVLVNLYPAQQATFDNELAIQLSVVAAGQAKTDGINLGAAVAAAVLAKRAGDGALQGQTTMPPGMGASYALNPAVGHWRPQPGQSNTPLGPGWGNVATFGIVNGQQFRAAVPAPPALDSAEYATAYNEVKTKGAAVGTVGLNRTATETNIGLSWAYDVGGLGPPPVAFNAVTQVIANNQGNTLTQNARLFALVNMAMADAGIACWDSKYVYDFWRPISGIREGDNDGNGSTLGDINWSPLGAPAGTPFTPPFPAYASGHSTFGAALFKTIEKFYGTDNIPFVFDSEEPNTVPINYTTLSGAALDNAISRVYLGVHWRFDSELGLAQGNLVGDYVFTNNLQPVPEPSTIVLGELGGLVLFAAARKRRRMIAAGSTGR